MTKTIANQLKKEGHDLNSLYTKHTPGPWTPVEIIGGHQLVNNGRAAPELLEACQDTLTRLEWWSKDPVNRKLDAAFAVLKKAMAAAE